MSKTISKYKILLINTDETFYNDICSVLDSDFSVIQTSSEQEANDVLNQNNINIVIYNQDNKNNNGINFLQSTIGNFPDVVRILVSEHLNSELLIKAINNAKIYRYIQKPYKKSELQLVTHSIYEYLSLKEENDRLLVDLKKLFTGTISAITDAIDGKNPYIYGKSRRVAFCAIKLAKAIGLSDEEISKIDIAGLLHDIGMIGIPERVLNKPGKFSDEEKAILKQHVENGINILKDIKQLKDIIEIIKYHHEQYDGSGYPYGLKGEEIPIGARILAVADAYDGLISDRAYRKGFTHEKAVEELKNRKGLDKNLVNKFIEIMNNSLDEFKCFEEELKNI